MAVLAAGGATAVVRRFGIVGSARRRSFGAGGATGGNRRRLLAGGEAGRVSGAVALNGEYIDKDTKAGRYETSHGRTTARTSVPSAWSSRRRATGPGPVSCLARCRQARPRDRGGVAVSRLASARRIEDCAPSTMRSLEALARFPRAAYAAAKAALPPRRAPPSRRRSYSASRRRACRTCVSEETRSAVLRDLQR